MNFNDPDFRNQWYLGPDGINSTAVYDDYTGRGVRIGITDTGLDLSNPDLAAVVDVAAGWNALNQSTTITNPSGNQHGTWVAEFLAAQENNGYGMVGVAFDATLVPFTMDQVGSRTPAQELTLLQRQWQVDISHNSWSYTGTPFFDNFLGAFAQQGAAIANAATVGRGGLGTVIVRSAGNMGNAGEDMNTHNYQNNRFTMAVAATDGSGNVRFDSNPGAGLWVSAPGEATSFAATMVSGTVALMLEANPGLGYRDAQKIIALSARYTDGDASWISNAATEFNGGGMRSSRETGFGLVDARAAVRLAESWTGTPQTEANILRLGATGAGFTVADVGTATSKVAIDGGIKVERAELTLDLQHPNIGDLKISLVSANGTESVLLDRIMNGSYAGGSLNFSLTSSQFYGELGQGDWTLKVQDAVSGGTAQVKNWKLDLWGSAPSADQTYYFTDRYTGLAQTEPARTTLRDTDGGTNTINAAAVSTDMSLDLRQGSTSQIAGETLTIAAGTVIRIARGGDGDDRIQGHDSGVMLYGGRGNDTLIAGAANDDLTGDQGNDRLDGAGGTDTAWFSGPQSRFTIAAAPGGGLLVSDKDGTLGTDTLFNIEQLGFTDGIIAAPAAPPPPPPPPATPGSASITLGSGPDSLELQVNQDAYQGSAQYTVSVDGVQIGGVQTAVALRSAGLYDTVTLLGDWNGGQHSLTVNFLNDAWDGTDSTDRNLYVAGVTYNGVAQPGGSAALMSEGPQFFGFTDTGAVTPPPATPGGIPSPANGGQTFQGSTMVDEFYGTNGDDVLIGGKGNDWMQGGPGMDSYVFQAGDGPDWVESFVSGEDKLVLTGLTAASLSWRPATYWGSSGIRVDYGADHVFLAGTPSIQASDILYA